MHEAVGGVTRESNERLRGDTDRTRTGANGGPTR
ncbi:hypothetical protein HTG_01605 [Natrinema mahii]|nr:hypothetical protein HTG_01605 [Natrinema mahii]